MYIIVPLEVQISSLALLGLFQIAVMTELNISVSVSAEKLSPQAGQARLRCFYTGVAIFGLISLMTDLYCYESFSRAWNDKLECMQGPPTFPYGPQGPPVHDCKIEKFFLEFTSYLQKWWNPVHFACLALAMLISVIALIKNINENFKAILKDEARRVRIINLVFNFSFTLRAIFYLIPVFCDFPVLLEISMVTLYDALPCFLIMFFHY